MPSATDKVTISKALLLENTQAGPTVFHDENSKTEVTWEGYGDSMGRDIQPVPAFYLENINFLRILNKGIVRVVDGPPEVLKLVASQLDNPLLARQKEAWIAQRDQKAGISVESLEHKQANDILAVKCIGPDASGRGECGNEVPIRQADLGDKPPLCSAHAELARYAVEFPTGEVVDGKEQSVWRLTKVEVSR